jgi:hypothetical protein
MTVWCQSCSAIGPALTDPRDAGWQEMTCVASCFDGDESWLCPACADSLRTIAQPEKSASVTEATEPRGFTTDSRYRLK